MTSLFVSTRHDDSRERPATGTVKVLGAVALLVTDCAKAERVGRGCAEPSGHDRRAC